MNKGKKLSIIVLFTFLLSIIVIPILSTAVTYKLGIEENTNVTWKVTYINTTAIQDLVNNENYDSGYLSYKVGDLRKREMDDIDDDTSGTVEYWKIQYEKFEADVGSSFHSIGDYYVRVCKDPTDLAYDWFVTEVNRYSILFLPKNPENYLAAFYNAIPGVNQSEYPITGNKYIRDSTQVGDHDMVINTYNSDGIRVNHSLYYDGILAYEYIASEITQDEFEFMLIFIIISAVAGIGITSAVIASAKRRNLTRSRQTSISKPAYEQKESPYKVARPVSQPKEGMFDEIEKTPPKPVVSPTPKSAKVTGTCELCGSDRDADAIFCPSCGNKF
jgi:hypothetical protein